MVPIVRVKIMRQERNLKLRCSPTASIAFALSLPSSLPTPINWSVNIMVSNVLETESRDKYLQAHLVSDNLCNSLRV